MSLFSLEQFLRFRALQKRDNSSDDEHVKSRGDIFRDIRRQKPLSINDLCSRAKVLDKKWKAFLDIEDDRSANPLDVLQTVLITYAEIARLISSDLSIKAKLDVVQLLERLAKVITAREVLKLCKIHSSAQQLFHRLLDLLQSLDIISQSKNLELNKNVRTMYKNILLHFIYVINDTLLNIKFFKDDLEKHLQLLKVFIFYVDEYIISKPTSETDEGCVKSILTCVWNATDKTIVVPTFVKANCPEYVLKWIKKTDILDIQRSLISIIHNIARHASGVKALNNSKNIEALKLFEEIILRKLDANHPSDSIKFIRNDTYIIDEYGKNVTSITGVKFCNTELDTIKEMYLFYCMAFSLLYKTYEVTANINKMNTNILGELLQIVVNSSKMVTLRYNGCHISEPLVVLAKLFVDDTIISLFLSYKVKDTKIDKEYSMIEFFCNLLIQFRGLFIHGDYYERLTLRSLFNIIYSISCNKDACLELKLNGKLLIIIESFTKDNNSKTSKSVYNDELDVMSHIHMSSISEAASGILLNIKKENKNDNLRTFSEMTNTTISAVHILPTVMIIYSNADYIFCAKLVDALSNYNEFNVVVDFNMVSDNNWLDMLESLKAAAIILLIITDDFYNSRSCRHGIYFASLLNKKIILIFKEENFKLIKWLDLALAELDSRQFVISEQFDDDIIKLSDLICKTLNIQSHINQQKNNDNDDPNKRLLHSLSQKPVEQWTKTDVINWFHRNNVTEELCAWYEFQDGNELIFYADRLLPNWEHEYEAIKCYLNEQHDKKLERSEFETFVLVLNNLMKQQQTKRILNNKKNSLLSVTCTIT